VVGLGAQVTPADSLKIGRGSYRVIQDKAAALLEAHVVSLGSTRRPVYVLDLAAYFDGNRTGYVVLERPQADLFGAVVAIVVAV
jgi:hypothetical protein